MKIEFSPELEDRDKLIKNEQLSDVEGRTGGMSEEGAGIYSRDLKEKRVEVDEKIEQVRSKINETFNTPKEYSEVVAPEVSQTKTNEAPKEKSFKNKILSFFGQAPEQLQEKYEKQSEKYARLGEERMKKNDALRKKYEEFKITEDEKVAEDYKRAIGEWRYIARDEDGNFIDKTRYTAPMGEDSALKK